MKKAILIVGCLSLFAAAAISISCSKDKEWKGCSCTITHVTFGGEEKKEIKTVSAAELEEEDIISCAELRTSLKESSDYYDIVKVSCSDL